MKKEVPTKTSDRKPSSPTEDVEEPLEPSPKRPVGRPPLELPDSIPDTPENIARVVLNTKPKKRWEWRFERKGRKE